MIVSVVLLFRQAGGHHFALCMHGLRTAGRGEFQHLYGSWRAAATQVGMSPDCRKLGLGVLEISIAADTGQNVMACCASAAGPAPYVLHQPPGYPELYLYFSVKIYITWDYPCH